MLPQVSTCSCSFAGSGCPKDLQERRLWPGCFREVVLFCMMLWATSHPQIHSSTFLEVNKFMPGKPTKSTKSIAAAATTNSATPVPVDDETPLVATSEHLREDSSPAGPQGIPPSLSVSVTEPTLAPQAGDSISRLKDILRAVRAKSFLGAFSVPQEKQKGDVNVVPEVQPDVEPFEGATAPRQGGSEGPMSQLERQRRQGERVMVLLEVVFETADVSDSDEHLGCPFSVTP